MARQRGKKRVFTRWSLTTKLTALLSGSRRVSVGLGAVLTGGPVAVSDLILTERGDFLLTEAGAFLEA